MQQCSRVQLHTTNSEQLCCLGILLCMTQSFPNFKSCNLLCMAYSFRICGSCILLCMRNKLRDSKLGYSESYIQLLFWSSWLQSCSELCCAWTCFQSKNILASQTVWDLKRHTSCYAYLRHEPDLLSLSILF